MYETIKCTRKFHELISKVAVKLITEPTNLIIFTYNWTLIAKNRFGDLNGEILGEIRQLEFDLQGAAK